VTSVIVSGIDPGFAHMGIAKMSLDLVTLELDLLSIKLIDTESSDDADRKSHDDLRRARELHTKMQAAISGSDIIFAEIPSGTKSARASWALGISVGIVASCPLSPIEIKPVETKMASVGNSKADKKQMIARAYAKYPDADWKRVRDKPTGRVTLANQHTADAIGVIHAGLLTPQFELFRRRTLGAEPQA
jgi:Holliday junction resolvasome RuvABC endonuclease subunit